MIYIVQLYHKKFTPLFQA